MGNRLHTAKQMFAMLKWEKKWPHKIISTTFANGPAIEMIKFFAGGPGSRTV